MTWTAIVPKKQSAGQKSRLSGRLSEDARGALSDFMAAHVVRTLLAVPAIEQVKLLSPVEPAYQGIGWVADKGRGLNAELCALRTVEAHALLIVHADLPLLAPGDIEALLRAAEQAGCAIAPDRHGTGTNGLALAGPGDFAFGFGEGSFQKHLALRPAAAIVRLPGLSHDVDTPDDLEAAVAAGFQWKTPPGH